jgi:hypothetical protein
MGAGAEGDGLRTGADTSHFRLRQKGCIAGLRRDSIIVQVGVPSWSTHTLPKVPMLPQDPMTLIIMIGNLAVLIALLLLIRNRRAS